MTILAFALVPMSIVFLLVLLFLAFGHLALRQNGREPVKRPISYIMGVGTLNLSLSVLFVAWAIMAPAANVTATEMAVLCVLALWVVTLAGFVPTIGLRQLFGDPDDETETQRRQRRMETLDATMARLKETP
jgi:chromate transport protein ChrA